MKISEKFKSGKTLFAFELLPPLKGQSISNIFETVERLKIYDPAYINITYHQQQTELVEMGGGMLERRTVRKRPGTVAIAASIASRYGIDVVPHLICGGFSRSDIEDMLIDLSFLGIDNVLALRGDSQSGERSFTPHSKGHTHACELVSQIMEMNSGHYLDTSLLQARATDFCIGVAGYPEKHIEAPNFTTDIDNLKHKIDLGAQYVVTQMFFDNSHYFSYVEKCRLAGITVPIVAGLKPFSTARQLTLLPQTFGLDLPEGLSAQVLNHINDAAAIRQIGTQWAIDQGLELMAAGVPALHFYTMGNADNIVQVAGALFSK